MHPVPLMYVRMGVRRFPLISVRAAFRRAYENTGAGIGLVPLILLRTGNAPRSTNITEGRKWAIRRNG